MKYIIIFTYLGIIYSFKERSRYLLSCQHLRKLQTNIKIYKIKLCKIENEISIKPIKSLQYFSKIYIFF